MGTASQHVGPVTAVVVTYQSADTIAATLESVRRCHDEGLLKCIVVDNGSTDETRAVLDQYGDWVDIVVNERNLGFGRACNAGLARVRSPYTLFLNPDATIEPEPLRKVLAFLESSPHIGVVGPATVCGGEGEAQVLQVTGPLPTPASMLPRGIGRFRKDRELRAIQPGEPPFRTGWVCGAVFLTRTDLIKSLGGFDPRFFLYWEETDVCRRVYDFGLEVWAFGEAVAYHQRCASSVDDGTRIDGCVARHFYQSRRYYMIKHYGWFVATATEFTEFLWLATRTLADALRGKGLWRIRPRLQARLFSQPEQV